MAKNKVTLTGMGLKKLTIGVNEIEFNDSIIEVIEYIPTPLKFTIINDTLLLSYINGIFNPIAMEATFHAMLVEHTTNINFSKKETEHLIDTYDLLNKAGIIDIVCDALGEEYDKLVEDLMEIVDKNENKVKTLAEQLTELLSSITDTIQEIGNIDEDNLAMVKNAVENLEILPKQ